MCDKKNKLKADHTQIRGEKKRGRFTSNANFTKKVNSTISFYDDIFIYLSVIYKSEKFYCSADKDIQISIRSRGIQNFKVFTNLLIISLEVFFKAWSIELSRFLSRENVLFFGGEIFGNCHKWLIFLHCKTSKINF